ncbi:MAG: InlB B-repeat-containing protein [Lachnospiraceae bacterium]|nr:InlB B-repeat-containing protein [Lachnospiraceae bacterium]
MKRTAKKLTVWFLTALIILTSVPFSTLPAYAQEQTRTLPDLPADNIGTETPADQTTPPDDDEETDAPDDEQAETPDEEQLDTPETPGEEQTDIPEEEPDALEEELLETVSANALSIDKTDGELMEIALELDGVYQFGGSPTNDVSPVTYAARAVEDPDGLEAAIDEIYQQLKNGNKVVNITSCKVPFHDDYDPSDPDKSQDLQTVNHLLTGLLNKYPDIFWFQQRASYSYTLDSTGTYFGTINFTNFWNEELYAEREDVENAVSAALAFVTDRSNQLQTAIELHDYLAVNCEYDFENYNNDTIPRSSYTINGVFKKRIAVCQGYALAYKYLLNQCGITCYMVTSDNIDHAWNMIELNGKYYQVDVTWDDPTWDLVGRACHDNMFRSDAAFSNHLKNGAKDWQVTESYYITDHTATDTTYDDAFWIDSTAPLVFYGDACYYTAFDFLQVSAVIRKKESALADTIHGTNFHTIGRWPAAYPDDLSGYYGSSYSGLFQVGGRLYYNDYDEIRSIAMDGTDDVSIFKPDSLTPGWVNGYIFGCAFYPEPPDDPGNPYKIHYSLHDDPILTEKETVLVVDAALPQPDDPIPALLTRPEKTTYLIGETLDLTGGKVNYPSDDGRKTEDLTAAMVSGFDSSKAGIKTLTVTYDTDKTLTFDVLIVEVPAPQSAIYGQKLNDVSLSAYNNKGTGTYAWKDGMTVLETEGEQMCTAIFTPTDLSRFRKIELEITVTVEKIALEQLTESNTSVSLEKDSYVYDGTRRTPKVTVTYTGKDGKEINLIKNVDYTLAYGNNTDAGNAKVTVTGKGAYEGSIEKTFTITQASLTITARDKTIKTGDPLPAAESYEYTMTGMLFGTDILNKLPIYTCSIATTYNPGEYDIVPGGADAGPNYIITYVNGKLTVTGNAIVCTVRFDVQGHGATPAPLTDLTPGSKVTKPENPRETGYRFDGWYKEAACINAWLFDTDTVQADMTLYAKWTEKSSSDDDKEEEPVLTLSEIPDLVYTGKAQKPALSVSYGKTLLRAGRDYTLKYYNNVNANAGGVQKDGSSFNPSLPYVQVTGKGNYAAVRKLNFNILPRSIGDGSETPASDVKLKVTDQFAMTNKAAKPFSSIRSVTAMRTNKDFSLRLTAINALDPSGAALTAGTELADASIPAGYSGEFLLTITGLGNYTGSIAKHIYIADKAHLLKNMTITLGKNLKNIPFQNTPVELTPSEILTPDTFIVKYGNTVLLYGRDYTVSYRNNDRVGKAELIVTGIGAYAGTKTATFTIKGKAFTAKKVRVNGIENKVYTGLPLTQEGISLTYCAGTADEQLLIADTDFTITYAKNTDKGTATMTFTGLKQAGFSGSFKKTFKIAPAPITDTTQAEAMSSLSFRYNKSGVKPVDEIVLTNPCGFVLQNYTDYSLRYLNNNAVAEKTDPKPPTVIVKGRGNYTGELKVFFSIRKADFDNEEDGLLFTAVSIPYLPGKPADYAYTPVINVWDGNNKLRLDKDYTITYLENTQADYESFVKTLKETPKNVHPIPRVVITPTADSPYLSSHTVLLPVYMTELTKDNVEIKIVGDTYYTGRQVKPKVEVYYKGENGKVLLQEGNHKDYVVVYGANDQTGKNKGSLTIHGTVPDYGGYVTVKFDIQKRSFSK